MKKLFFFLIIGSLISLGASSQIYQPATLYGKKERGLAVERMFSFPTGCGNPATPAAPDLLIKMGAFFYDSCAKRTWIWDPKLAAWDSLHIGVSGGADGNNFPSSLSFTDNQLTLGRTGLGSLTASLDSSRWHTLAYYNTLYSDVNNVWFKNGNIGTNPLTHFIGSVDGSVRFRANNHYSGFIDTSTNAQTNFGYRALENWSSGVWSTAMGYWALRSPTVSSENTAVGAYSQWNNAGSSSNVSVGSFTLAYISNATGRNVAVGVSAMNWSTTARENVAIGNYNMLANRQGNYNVALGSSSMRGNVKGSSNTAVGHITLTQNTTNILRIDTVSGGSGYTAGLTSIVISAPTVLADPNNNSLQATATPIISGGKIVGITIIERGKGYTDITDATGSAVTATVVGDGSGAVLSVTLASGEGNTAVGLGALAYNLTGSYNVAIGGAMVHNYYGNHNAALGFDAMTANSYGSNNTAIGDSALRTNTTGNYNVTLGYLSDVNSATAVNRTAIGTYSRSDCDNCMVLGSINGVNSATADTKVGIGTTTARQKLDVVNSDILVYDKTIGRGVNARLSNTVFGDSVLAYSATTTANNTAIGYLAMRYNAAGGFNTAIGSNAMAAGVSEIGNTAIGAYAMAGTSATLGTGRQGYNGTAIGLNSMARFGGGSESSGIGSYSLYEEKPGLKFNTAIGVHSQRTDTNGTHNTSIGWASMYQQKSGTRNTAIGSFAMGRGNAITGGTATGTGDDNTAIGAGSLYALIGGSGNIAIGSAAANLLVNGSYNTIIGGYSGTAIPNFSNHILLSDGQGNVRLWGDSVGSWSIGSTAPVTSAKLDIQGTTRGVLFPRLNTTQQAAIASPATGLLIWNTDSLALCHYNGSAWLKVGGGGGSGSGTVNTGAADRLAYYSGAGTIVDDLAAITANRALISDASGLPIASSVTNTELGYMAGVTSAVQTQIDGKVGTSRTISTTSPLTGGGDLSANRTIAIDDAAADGTTKGAATFTAADFNSSSGNISIDYTNGQAASGSVKGFLTSADWTTFNSKIAAGAITSSGLTQATNRLLGRTTASTGAIEEITVSSPLSFSSTALGIQNAAADGSTKGAASFTAADFDASSGNIGIDYTNGQASSGSTNGFLSSTDWTTFNSKEAALTFSTGLTRSVNTITANLSVGVSGGQTAIGGTGVGDVLSLKGTTGNGTSTVASLQFNVGNNGATTGLSIYNSGVVHIGNPTYNSAISPNIQLAGNSKRDGGRFYANNLTTYTSIGYGGVSSPATLDLEGQTGINVLGSSSTVRMNMTGGGLFNFGNSSTATEVVEIQGNMKTNGQYYSARYALTDAATIAINWNNSLIQGVTLGGNRTITFANPKAGARYVIELTQDGTGSRTITWPTIRWSGGAAPTLTTTAAKTDLIFIYYNGTDYFGSTSLNF